MRRQQQAWSAAQRVIGGRRLGREDVERGAAQATGLECVGQRALVDDPAAGRVHDDRSVRQKRELFPADEPARPVGQRHVHAEDVGATQ